jgi:hypothetical protein
MISHTKTGGGFFSNCGDEKKEEYIFSEVIEVVAGNSVDANTSSFTVRSDFVMHMLFACK